MALTILVQFVFRLAFGLALAMLITPAKHVTSGFFRVHLWVVMGLSTLAALASLFHPGGNLSSRPVSGVLVAALATGVASYFGAVFWLYQRATAGKITLAIVTVAALAGALLDTRWPMYASTPATTLAALDVVSGGLLLGATMAAMLLGHWYLNTPTMQLLPLKRLVLLIGGAVAFRALISGAGLGLVATGQSLEMSTWLFISMRWLSGILGTAILTVMTWQTLKVPNTQSATGILYVAVICSFLGELTSQLLSAEASYPL